MNYIEILKFAGIPSVVLALVMYVARKQTQILAQGSTVNDINDSFAHVPGPVVSAVFSDRDPSEQVEIQKKIIPMLHQLNYLSTLWSLRHLKVLRVIPCPLLSRKDWEQRLGWYKNIVWDGWLRKYPELVQVNDHLIATNDFQNTNFGLFYTRLIQEWKAEAAQQDDEA